MQKLLASAAVTAIAGIAVAQPDLVYNGSFETPAPLGSGPDGWRMFNTAAYRNINDGPNILTRTGDYSVELASGADFVGADTNAFDPNTLDYYDPKYVWRGGACRACGWYAIPADQPLTGANAGMKIEFRRDNFSVYMPVEDLFINGHTDGQWRQACITVGCDELPPDFPPFPITASVLVVRFGDVNSTGTIFWDDVTFQQCLADFTCDDMVNTNDFFAFLAAYQAQDARADLTGDGNIDTNDFFEFLSLYQQGCF